MKPMLAALSLSALFFGSAYAQSVAQSIESLNAKVARLELQSTPRSFGSLLPSKGAETDANGNGLLELKTAAGKDHVRLSGEETGAALRVISSEGKDTVALSGSSHPFLRFSRADGQESLYLGLVRPRVSLLPNLLSPTLPAYAAHLRLYNDSGKIVVDAGANNTGSLQISDASGAEAVYLGVDLSGKGIIRSTGKDYAEAFETSGETSFPAGSVMSTARSGSGLRLASETYDPGVVGVISGAGDLHAGAIMGSHSGQNEVIIALAGQVFVRVCSQAGAIAPGDLLVASGTPGVAMRGADRSRLIGTVIGKALEPFPEGEQEGLIRMLVMNH